MIDNNGNGNLKKEIESSFENIDVEKDLQERMEKYNIRFENDKYIYQTYKYDKLKDAINYAELMNQKNK